MIDYRLLGPFEVALDGHALDVGGLKQRALLAILLLYANQAVPRDVLIDHLWDGHPPPGADHAVGVYIWRLRKALDSVAGSPCVLTRAGGYLLQVTPEQVDLARFGRLAEDGHRCLAAGQASRAAAQLREALALWRGSPLADFKDETFAQAEITRLEKLRAEVAEDRIEADLALGQHAGVVSELETLVAAHPLRERPYQQLMVALYRCGRQAEALAVYQTARRVFVDELGVEPSPALQRVERAILEQDASLDPPSREVAALAFGSGAETVRASPIGAGRGKRLLAIAGALAVALVLLVTASTHGSAQLAARPDSVAVIDAARGGLSAVVRGVGRPNGIAPGAGAIWVTDSADNLLLRVDSARQVVDRIPVGRGPAGVVAGAGEIWVANEFDNTVSEVNPRTGTVVASPIGVGGGPVGLAYGYGSVWAANVTDATLSRIDPGSGIVTATIPLGSSPDGVAAGAGGIWVASAQAGRLLLVDPRRNRVIRAFPVGVSPDGVAVGAGGVWVSDAGGTVARLNPVTGRMQQIKVGGSPAAIAFADGAVWVANGLGSVFRIDPRTRRVRSFRVGNEPSGLAGAGGNVLVTVLPSLASHRGGTLTMVSSGTVPAAGLGSSDPALAWNLVDWQMLTITNDGLVGFRRAGGPAGDQLVPDLARYLPAPASHGTTYTFRLRAGIRYSNGQPVRPEDFRRALERVFILNHGGAPASYFYSGIVGAAACERHPQGCTLARGIVTNDQARTVTFRLTAPDPDFLDKLALPFADAVPAGTPDHQLNPAQIPATGPYLTRSLNPTRAWVLVRNPRFHPWSAQAQPGGYPDRIILRLGAAPAAAVDAVEHGRADVLSGPPASRIHQLTTRYANLLHTDPLADTVALFLNTRVRPFAVLAARQAVNYAIDRNTLIQLTGGPTAAQPTCQILPPTLPGYQPYCPYTINPGPSGAWQAPDLARAQQLARRSGTLGDKVTLVTGLMQAGMSRPAVGRYLVSVLRQIGYRASLRAITSQGTFWNTIGNSRDRIQAGEFNWGADYPAPWDFFGLLFSCQSFLPGNPVNLNDSEYCNPRTDAQIRQALAAQARSPGAAWLRWANIDQEITGQAPWVPLYNPRALVVLAARVGNYQFHPLFGLLIDQLWVR